MPQTIAVIGGTGTFGSRAVTELARRGYDVRVLSRTPRPGMAAEHRPVDLVTGAGLDAALDGVDLVVDSASAQGRRMREVMVGGTRRAAEAGRRAGVAHHVLISIVGIERVPLGYYKVKLAQEAALDEVAGDALPHTVLRATQFHQLLDGAFSVIARAGVLPAGPARLQPVDPAEVAVALAELIARGPGERQVEFAGPEIETLGALSASWAHARGRRRLRVPIPAVGSTLGELGAGALTSDSAPRGRLNFADWLARG